MQPRVSRIVASAAVALVAVSGALGAQQSDTARARELRGLDSLILDVAAIAVQGVTTQQMVQAVVRGQPGNVLGSESAFGAGWGDLFAGVGYQARGRFTSLPDGSAGFGFGLGSPRRDLGLEVALNSASTFRQGLGRNGSVSLKLHRVLPGAYGVAVGFENIASWGGTDGGSSTYGVVSHTVKLRDDPNNLMGSVAWNIGVGNSRFLSQQALAVGNGGVNVFGSAGFRFVSRAAFVADWTGQDLDVGISAVPMHRSPLVFSISLADVTRRAGDGPRLVIGAGAGFRIFDMFRHTDPVR